MTEYRMFDTVRPDGCYVSFHMIEHDDCDASPLDWMDADEDADRIASWRRGDWSLIGIQARADIVIVRNGHDTVYELLSPGLWAVESDSGEEYLRSVFADECDTLRGDMAAMGTIAA
jgi:hypothetical protein